MPSQPGNRLARARLQQMHERNLPVPKAERGITRAEPDCLLYQRNRVLYGPGIELALAESGERVYPVAIQRQQRLVFGNGLRVSALRAQQLTFGVMRKWAAGDVAKACSLSPLARSISAADEAVISPTTQLAARTPIGSVPRRTSGRAPTRARTG